MKGKATTPRGPSAIVLAAGASSRFRGTKQLAELSGRTLVRRAIEAIPAAAVSETLVVVGFRAKEVGTTLGGRARTVHNARFREGMGSSVRAGIEALAEGTPGALILLADQPFVTRALVKRVLSTFEAKGGIVAAARGDLVAPPVVFSRSYFDELTALRGDRGAKAVIELHPGALTRVEVRSDRTLLDIDTREDLEAARRLLER